VAALVATFMLSIGAAGAQTAKVDAMLTLTENDNDRAVELRVGDSVHISLSENATTGYRWAIEHLDESLIEAIGSEPQYKSGAIGSGGQVTFRFRATKAGNSEIALKNWRHFEGDGSVTKRFRVRLLVKS
jgi:inhibitor of cysteine peptidase